MARGRKDIKETDASLARSEKVVAETIAIGAATAATLDAQAWSPQPCRAEEQMCPAMQLLWVRRYLSVCCDGCLALNVKDLEGHVMQTGMCHQARQRAAALHMGLLIGIVMM